MIGAVIVGGLALISVIGSIITLAFKLSSTQADREAWHVKADVADEHAKWQDAKITTLTKDLKTEQERADALDAEFTQLAASAPVDGAYQRLLSQWATAHAAARGRTVALSQPAAAPKTGPDDLLPPGA